MIKVSKSIIYLGLATGVFTSSCNRDFLNEEAITIYTPENSLQNASQFQTAINNLYNGVRNIHYGNDINLDAYFGLFYATDFAYNATDYAPAAKLNEYEATMLPSYTVPQEIWTLMYKIITNANVVINRVGSSESLSDDERNKFLGEALFFRAYSYNMLANLYGGVPLELDGQTVPRFDYTRATRAEVYQQCRIDFETAISMLKNIEQVRDGEVNKQIAQHYLAETLISLGDHEAAVTAATEVINHSGLHLMTERFGRRLNDLPKNDVYRDLFEYGNQNYSSGNREGLWTLQSTFNNTASVGDRLVWAIVPALGSLALPSSVDPGRTSRLFLNGLFNDEVSLRGVGWIRPTSHFLYTVWSDKNDIRNSPANIVRDFRIEGVPTSSPHYGKWYVADGYKAQVLPVEFRDTIRSFYPVIRKTTVSRGDFPAPYLNGTPAPFGGSQLRNENFTWRAKYVARLAETYLLRAEAYLAMGNTGLAAQDINLIRARSKAGSVAAAQIDIDFILDERLRELYAEEFRVVTLGRLNRRYNRVSRYNPLSGLTIKEYHNLWPIPQNEITQNTDAVIDQNPGYRN
ncbi:RagB/SusD family nutrient uptake outer membrane protein [Sphingobacterium paludis]|uniref:Putative outer membrane starch-binding protein n=1 Tax=Sphingobacterium paludis TaxID=1476465 RepID=A0A4R7CRC9_9SPHI|nr:RagB/SusD family nutrient uptake outer membrane protein [Sphingobacterium paludis]TDS08928.1 putative outer membrane starch-binding protein [Sphingobacterium paludis]